MSSASTSSSTILFPASEPTLARNVYPVPQIHGPYLPFRRISLPTTPSKLHRESMISVTSFKSMPEDREAETHSSPAVIRDVQLQRKEKSHTKSTTLMRGRRSHVLVRPVDDAKLLKRGKVIEEFYETERTYVEGLDLIYSQFLRPIIASLDKSEPLLDRAFLTLVFSNFVDIWNLHRSFFSSLQTFLTTSGIPSTSTANSDPPPPLSPLLLSHFPYLSLYNPFVTAFPTTISALTDLVTPPSSTHPNPKYSAAFTTFLASQESDPRCGKLKLRDWLLTIVQRCPRYLLLLKDLIACTDEEDPEYAHLEKVQAIVSKVTLSLNTSLHTHEQTLALLSLQRATSNLPFQLIFPGRALLRRGPLFQIDERSGSPREREFLLFSDCLIWLAREAVERARWKDDWGISRSGWGFKYIVPDSVVDKRAPETLNLSQESRSWNKIEDEVSPDQAKVDHTNTSQQEVFTTTPTRLGGRNKLRKSYHPHPNVINMRNVSKGGDERWIFKGRAELIDLEIVVTPAREEGEERRFEILSPEGSFVLYSGTGEDRDQWCNEIRQAKAQLLSSLNVTHPNSTLASSSSTSHLRRSLQALPFSPAGERVATDRAGKNDGKSKGKVDAEPLERRRKVEHWVPAIWIPDHKTSECMRCGKSFSWRRRRHHCRLCGRCVCASCSGRTFFISDPHAKDNSNIPARACNACYETVFPLVDPAPGAPLDMTGTIHKCDADSFPSCSGLPSWLPIPSFPVTTTPQALMAIDREPYSPRGNPQDLPDHDQSGIHQRIRARPLQNARVRSYNQLLVDFEENEHERFNLPDSPLKEESDSGENEFRDQKDEDGSNLNRQSSHISSNVQFCLFSPPRKDDTARRKKRLSLPAVAVHTTKVTTRTSVVFDDDDFNEDGSESPVKANRTFSLVLGHHGNSGLPNQSEATTGPGRTDSVAGTRQGLGKSIAAGKLGEILARKRD